MEVPEILLAKTTKDYQNSRYEETLLGHTESVVKSFECIFGSIINPTHLSEKWFSFFNLNNKGIKERFYLNTIIACYLHDIGKANSGFQRAVRGTKSIQSIRRHEHLSGLIIWLPQIKAWLKGNDFLDYEVIICSVIGHHLKADKEKCFSIDPDLHTFKVFFEGISQLLGSMSLKIDNPNPIPNMPNESWSKKYSSCYDPTQIIKNLTDNLVSFHREIRKDEKRNRLLQAVRSAVIISDSVGSGLVREGKSIEYWINEAFDESKIQDGTDIERKVIDPRIKEIEESAGSFSWNDFQIGAEKLPERSLLIAPCGSGKTLAAWRWIKAQANRNRVSRIIFLYPTRGTATEGFRDYVSWAPEADAALIHGTAKYELTDMFENPADMRSGKDFTTEDRLFALGYWQRRIFSATVDQFLGFMQNFYRSICLLPLLADSILVIDEVHSFDKNMFSSLKAFLKNFQLPVFCMTASLPNQRIQEMKECGLVVYPDSFDDYPGLLDSAKMPRYNVHLLEGGVKDAEKVVGEMLDQGDKKILWVVNTIDRCQFIAKKFDALCYHSRFKLDDRKVRHREVISALQPSETGPKIAVTTQVCEMSLDIDADVLITERAPVTSLIQRMGRCNRHTKPGDKKLGDVFIYSLESEKPYTKENLYGVEEFILDISEKSVSQLELQELLLKHGPEEVGVERYAAFLECGPWAEPREFREVDEYTLQAILDSDVELYVNLKKEHKPVDGLMLSIPRKFAHRDSRVQSWIGVAEGSRYDERFGFLGMSVEK